MNLGLAFRSFFRALGDAAFAERLRELLGGASEEPEALAPARIADARNPALTLLATLQREARFVDFLMEPLDDYPDEQVGAAARDVQRDCAAVIGRVFGPEPLSTEEEGSQVRVPEGFDPARFLLTGNVSGTPPYTGALRHHGWRATQCEMPAWSGSDESAMVLAPSEVEV